MAIGPVEGRPIPLLAAHKPFALELAPREDLPKQDALAAAGDGFLQLVISANEKGHSANYMAKELAAGRSDDIHGTMLELNKAGIETRLMVSVKDKIMDAFHEIWRMSV